MILKLMNFVTFPSYYLLFDRIRFNIVSKEVFDAITMAETIQNDWRMEKVEKRMPNVKYLMQNFSIISICESTENKNENKVDIFGWAVFAIQIACTEH